MNEKRRRQHEATRQRMEEAARAHREAAIEYAENGPGTAEHAAAAVAAAVIEQALGARAKPLPADDPLADLDPGAPAVDPLIGVIAAHLAHGPGAAWFVLFLARHLIRAGREQGADDDDRQALRHTMNRLRGIATSQAALTAEDRGTP